jgi:hypothetical protein
MKRIIYFLLLLAFGFTAKAQVTTQYLGAPKMMVNVRGFLVTDSLVALSKDTFYVQSSLRTHKWAAAKDDSLYIWVPSTERWVNVGAARTKLNTADTSTMLLNYKHWMQGYLKAPDIVGKVNYTDTAAMLLNYIVGPGYGLIKSGKFLRVDTINVATRDWVKWRVDSAIAQIVFPATGPDSLSNLLDVTVAYPVTSGQVLKYDGSKWVPAPDQTGAAGGGITHLNGDSSSTQSFATGTTGTDFNIVTGSGVHNFNIPTTSSSNRGLVTSVQHDLWNTVSSKLNISDTATMLNNYRHWLANYTKNTDTSAMLSNYRHWLAGYLLSESDPLSVKIADSASMLSNYRHWAAGYLLSESDPLSVKIADSASMLSNYIVDAGYGNKKGGKFIRVDSNYVNFRLVDSAVANDRLSKWRGFNTPIDNVWVNLAYSPKLNLFVAVSHGSTTDGAMWSYDGINWTISTTEANQWRGVTWSPKLGMFVAVAASGTNRVMYSYDGKIWTAVSDAGSKGWRDVKWIHDLGLFVAVAYTGTGDRVMTSPDGINWTGRTTPEDNEWNEVVWSPELGLLVAVASSGTNQVMTSPDGITWTARSVPTGTWEGLAYSPQLRLFVAVARSLTNRVMTSPDGINWTVRSSPTAHWLDVDWSPELGAFAAVADYGTVAEDAGDRVMISFDGINWTAKTTDYNRNYRRIKWIPEHERFAAIAFNFTYNEGDGYMFMMNEPIDLKRNYLSLYHRDSTQHIQGSIAVESNAKVGTLNIVTATQVVDSTTWKPLVRNSTGEVRQGFWFGGGGGGTTYTEGYGIDIATTVISVDTTAIASKSFVTGMPAYSITNADIANWNQEYTISNTIISGYDSLLFWPSATEVQAKAIRIQQGGVTVTPTVTDSTLSWNLTGGGSGTPAGNDYAIQVNGNGSFFGEDNFQWNRAADKLKITGTIMMANSTTDSITLSTAGWKFKMTSGIGTNGVLAEWFVFNDDVYLGNAIAGGFFFQTNQDTKVKINADGSLWFKTVPLAVDTTTWKPLVINSTGDVKQGYWFPTGVGGGVGTLDQVLGTGNTSDLGFQLLPADPSSGAMTDGPEIILTGKGNDAGTVNSRNWKFGVDVTTTAGAGDLLIQNSLNAGGYAWTFRFGTNANLTIGSTASITAGQQNAIATHGSTVNNFGSTAFTDAGIINSANAALLGGQNTEIEAGANGSVSVATDSYVRAGAEYSFSFGDANTTYGYGSLTGGVGNYNYNYAGVIANGRDNVLGYNNTIVDASYANDWESGAIFGIGNYAHNGSVQFVAGRMLEANGSNIVAFGKGLFNTRMAITDTSSFNVGFNSTVPTFQVKSAAGGSTYGQTRIMGDMVLGTAAQITDTTTYKPLVRDGSGNVRQGYWFPTGSGGSTTINNNANNRLITGSATANTLEAEPDLSYDASINRLLVGYTSSFDNAWDHQVKGSFMIGTATARNFSVDANGNAFIRSTATVGGGTNSESITIETLAGTGSLYMLATNTTAYVRSEQDLSLGNAASNDKLLLTGSEARFAGSMRIAEVVAPSTPATGHVNIYAKSDGKVYSMDDAGTEYDLTATGAGGGITSLGVSGSGQTGATQTLATGTSGTDFNIASATNTHTFNIPTAAEGITRGLLSGTDWVTFNNKQAALSGTGFVKSTAGTISYDNSSYQPLDADLTTIAGLTATTDNFIVSSASAWASRTPAQVKTTLALNNVENTALSTWAGSANITTVGTIASGTWAGTDIANTAFRQSAGLSVVGRSANTTGDVADITGTDGQVLRVSGTTLGFGAIAQSSVTNLTTDLGNKQPLDADLTTISGLTATTDNFIVGVASAWASRTPTQVRTTLGLTIGTDVQAFDADLSTLAASTGTKNNTTIYYGDGTFHPAVKMKDITITSPTATENESFFYTPVAITVEAVRGILLGTTPSVTFTINYGSSRGTATGTIVASNTFDNADANYNTTGFAHTLNTTAIPAGSYIWITTSAVSGTIDNFNLNLQFRQ